MVVLKTRLLGWTGNWIIWGAIALVILIFSIFDFPIYSIPIFVSLSPKPSVTFVASNDIPAFSILTTKNVNILPVGIQNSNEIQHQEAKVYQHIALRAYEKGEEIQSMDLGPKLAANYTYQLREINVSASAAWIQTGDILAFILVNASCSTGTTPTTICSSQTNVHMAMKDIVVVQIDKTNQNSLLALLVAIPLEENTHAIAFLDTEDRAAVAYPLATLTTAP